MDVWNLVADRKIREAMEEGAFDQLQGAGKPVNLEENPYEDPSLRMAHRLLKNNGFGPSWIAESKDIDADIHRLDADRERCAPEELCRRTEELNRRIAIFNLKVPIQTAQKLPVNLDS